MPPTGGLVSLAEAQEHLGVPPAAADGELDPGVQLRIDAVSEMLDGPDSQTGRCFLARTIRVTWTGWPFGRRILPGGVLPAPVHATYEHEDGSVTWAGALPRGGLDWGGPFVTFSNGAPDDFLADGQVTLDFTAGDDVVPKDMKVLALSLLAEVDEHRSAVLGVGEGLGVKNPAMESILARYRATRPMNPDWRKRVL